MQPQIHRLPHKVLRAGADWDCSLPGEAVDSVYSVGNLSCGINVRIRAKQKHRSSFRSCHKKIRGCIAASPNHSFEVFLEKTTSSFSWLSLRPFYSPLRLYQSSASDAGGARIQSPCIEIESSLVKEKVNVLNKNVRERQAE